MAARCGMCLAGAAAALTAAPARAQDAGFTEALAGNAAPLQRTLRDIAGEKGWFRITLGEHREMREYLSGMGVGGGGGVCYTQGRTVASGRASFLLAYTPKRQPIDMRAMSGQGEPAPAPSTTADTVVYLTLVNLRRCGDLLDIGPFDLPAELASTAAPTRSTGARDEAAAAPAASGRLARLGAALLSYAADHGSRFPRMAALDEVRRVLAPYVKDESVYLSEETQAPLVPNPALGGRSLSSIARPARFVAFYEGSPGADRRIGAVFADGHAKRLTAAEWLEAKKASGIR